MTEKKAQPAAMDTWPIRLCPETQSHVLDPRSLQTSWRPKKSSTMIYSSRYANNTTILTFQKTISYGTSPEDESRSYGMAMVAPGSEGTTRPQRFMAFPHRRNLESLRTVQPKCVLSKKKDAQPIMKWDHIIVYNEYIINTIMQCPKLCWLCIDVQFTYLSHKP